MRIRVLLCVWAALAIANSTYAAEITSAIPSRIGEWLVVALRANDLLDAKTRSTVESGLPGSCIYRLTLQEDNGSIASEALLQYTLHFDPWEDRYVLRGREGEREFHSLAAADSVWSHPRDVRLARWASLPEQTKLRVHVQFEVRPIAGSDRLRLNEYVSQSSADGSSDFHIDIGALFSRLGGSGAERANTFISPSFSKFDIETEERPSTNEDVP